MKGFEKFSLHTDVILHYVGIYIIFGTSYFNF